MTKKKKHPLIWILPGKEKLRIPCATPTRSTTDPAEQWTLVRRRGRVRQCFLCFEKSHDAKTCPLRLCPTCKRYGHAETICPGLLSKFR